MSAVIPGKSAVSSSWSKVNAAWYLWAPTAWAHPGAVLFPPQWTQKRMSNMACEDSHMKDFGGIGLVNRNHSPFKGVVPSQHSSILGVGPYCGLTVH